MYKFIKKTNFCDTDINNFLSDKIGVLVGKYENVNLNYFGKIVPQDYYGQSEVDVGGKQHIWQESGMPWHNDRGYSDNIDDIAGLKCIKVDKSAGKTYFCDMQTPIKIASSELIEKCKKEYWHKLSKYYKYDVFPVSYEKESHRRLHKRSKSKRPLVGEDSLGLFFTYQEAYTECEFEEEIKKICYKEKYIYQHTWKDGDVVIFNNLKVSHKRDPSPKNIIRNLVRFAIKKNENRNLYNTKLSS